MVSVDCKGSWCCTDIFPSGRYTLAFETLLRYFGEDAIFLQSVMRFPYMNSFWAHSIGTAPCPLHRSGCLSSLPRCFLLHTDAVEPV